MVFVSGTLCLVVSAVSFMGALQAVGAGMDWLELGLLGMSVCALWVGLYLVGLGVLHVIV